MHEHIGGGGTQNTSKHSLRDGQELAAMEGGVIVHGRGFVEVHEKRTKTYTVSRCNVPSTRKKEVLWLVLWKLTPFNTCIQGHIHVYLYTHIYAGRKGHTNIHTIRCADSGMIMNSPVHLVLCEWMMKDADACIVFFFFNMLRNKIMKRIIQVHVLSYR
jgi:hypothetical protein